MYQESCNSNKFGPLSWKQTTPFTLWYFNIAIEHGPWIVDYLLKMVIFQFANHVFTRMILSSVNR